MIVRKGRKHENRVRRISVRAEVRARNARPLLSTVDFQWELVREIVRSDRRVANREFGLIRMEFASASDRKRIQADIGLTECFKDRLRISDSIGWLGARLSFLLPETDRDGTFSVANELVRIARENDLILETEVSIYPEDDELISLAQGLAEVTKSSREFDNHDGPSSEGGVAEELETTPSNVETIGSSVDASFNRLSSDKRVQNEPFAFVVSSPTPWWKRTFDILGASCGLIALSPVFVAAAVGVKMDSSGPIFFRQTREGKDGRPFRILKFRTMVMDAEEKQAGLLDRNEQDGPAFKIEDDPRITRLGKFLRKSCIDELPQLVNVIRGDMSLVGPRPLPVGESYGCTAWQRGRLVVLPGLTCTWQVSGGRDVTFSQWMRMDLEYIQQRSFWLDLKLIYRTVLVAVLHRGSV